MPDDAPSRIPSPPIDGRIVVRPEELERAISVWLTVMPPHLWRPYQKMLEVDPKRRSPGDRVDPRHVLAKWLADQFCRAKWEASYPEPIHPGSPPAWRGG